MIRELSSEILNLKASAVPPNLTRYLEAKTESQNYEIQSLQRDLQTTQDSLISWDEVNINSIQGVCGEESVATWTSSVSSITERAISHLPQAGCDAQLFQQREHAMPKAASEFVAALSTPPASVSKNLVAVHNSSMPTTSLPNGSTEAAATVLDYGGPKKREEETNIIDKWPQPAEF